MNKPFAVNRNPCASCPYRLDCPRGVWDASEYEKLRGFDDNSTVGVFLCHQTPAIGIETVCRGWLSVHADSVSVRLMVLRGQVHPEEPFRSPSTPLYSNGNEAADAGLAGVDRPGDAARRMLRRLAAKGIGHS